MTSVGHSFVSRILAVATFWCLVASGVSAQISTASQPVANNSAGTSAKPDPAFDAVSIRPSRGGEIPSGEGQLRADDYRAIGWPLWYTVGLAYLPRVLITRKRISGLPKWAFDDNYDFQGKVAATDLAEWERQRVHWNRMVPNTILQGMLRSALRERCGLQAHLVTRDIQGYLLVVGKHGPNMKQLKLSTPDERIPSIAQTIAEGGLIVPYNRGEEPVVTYFHTSMASLASALADHIGGFPVKDETGLSGKYDFALTRVDTDSDNPYQWDLGALGLKLKPVKLPADVLVVDHIQKPSAN